MNDATVKAPPFTGRIDPDYDIVNGRFALHVGPLRDPATGLSQKILWVLAPKYRRYVGSQLAITGRLAGVVRYRARFSAATRAGDPNYYFPSTPAPPKAGCWTMTLTTGTLKARLVALVREPGG